MTLSNATSAWRAVVAIGLLSGFCVGLLQAQQVDLIAAKQDQDTRLAALQHKLNAARQTADAQAVVELEKEMDAIHGENLWNKTEGTPALTLRDGQTFAPFNFAILGCTHLSERKGPQRLERVLDLIGQRRDIAFVIIMGDIVWNKDFEQLKPILAKANVPVYLVYGNNDWKWVQNGSIEKVFGPRDFTFSYANCRFIAMWNALPKEHPTNHKGDFNEDQWAWLQQQLQLAKEQGATHTFVAMHVPPTTPGSLHPEFFMFPQTEERFWGLIEQYDVTAGLFGHLHQAISWKHRDIQCYVSPSMCWNFIARGKKVESSFVRIVKVEESRVTDALIPVWLDGETFTWETLAQFYDPVNAPK